ncbi:hypothetical protein JWG44_00005 [Leptospira sp. 201903071]|uniref:hypothetical protein n=1 Tax=Leptospira ainazelensis TaxID=2810034 RepID=UPI001964F6AF|nr:hypothetical protein [Leptospira ainazelensis]MBM9498636.1 hypothetical protein [Leptospira ainazelensis]
MTEFNKIIRYLFPVFIYFGYTFLFISLLLLPHYIFYETLSEINLNTTFILAFSGGIGYVISLIHHYLFWNCHIYPKTRYTKYIASLHNRNLLELTSNNKRLIRKLDERDYWRILNIIWHRLREEDKALEKVNSRNDSLTDLMHGNGSSLVSLILSIITSAFFIIYLLCNNEIDKVSCFFVIVSFLVFGVAFLLHRYSYHFSASNLNRFFEDALFHALSIRANSKISKESKKTNGPLKFYIDRPN